MSNPNRQSPLPWVEPQSRVSATAAGEATWYCRIGGTVYGPVTTQTLKRWVSEHRLLQTDEIKRRVDGQFVSASWYGALFDGASKDRVATTSNNPHRTSVQKSTAASGTKSLETTETASSIATQQELHGPIAEAKSPEPSKQKPTDDDLLRSFAEQFASRNINSFARIGLDVKQGVVRLEGTVPTEGEYLLLIHLIRNTPGVVMVKDGLLVAGRNPSNKKAAKAKPSLPRSTFVKDAVSNVFATFQSKKFMNAAISVASVLLVVGGAAVALQAKSLDAPPSLYPAKGTATLSGKPMTGASIVLYRADAGPTTKGVHSRAVVDDDGRFELGTVRPHDGAPIGDYIVTITWTKQTITNGRLETSPNLAPAKYASRDTSHLKVTINKGTNQIPAIELQSE